MAEVVLCVVRSPRADYEVIAAVLQQDVIYSREQGESSLVGGALRLRALVAVGADLLPLELLGGVEVEAAGPAHCAMDARSIVGARDFMI